MYQFQRSVVRPGDECVFRLLEDDFVAAEAIATPTDFDVVVLSGSDGTAVVAALRACATGVPVCVFRPGRPTSSTPTWETRPSRSRSRAPAAWARLADLDLGSLSWADVGGTTSQRGFALMSGTGFDAQLMQAALPNKALMGEAAYYAAALANPRPDV